QLALDVGQQPLLVLFREPRSPREYLDVRLKARQGRAEFVRCVGHEAPLRLDRIVQLREHRVEGGAEPGELVSAGCRDTLARVARPGDALRRVCETCDGRERRARDEGAAGG